MAKNSEYCKRDEFDNFHDNLPMYLCEYLGLHFFQRIFKFWKVVGRYRHEVLHDGDEFVGSAIHMGREVFVVVELLLDILETCSQHIHLRL